MKLIYILPLFLIPFAITEASAYRGETFTDEAQPDGSYLWTGGLSPYLDSGNTDEFGRKIYVHYFVDDQPAYVKVSNGEASFIFDKNTCSAKIYGSGIINNENNFIIGSDSFVPKMSVDGSGVWSVVNSINDATCVTEIIETDNSIEISGTKTSSAGIFKVRYVKEDGKPLESFLEATNLSGLTDRKFGVTQTQSVPRIITFAGQERDLADHVGQTFGRQWLENNKANLLVFSNTLKFDTLKAWDNLESIKVNSVTGDTASISFNYLRNTQILLPNETLIIDPTYGYTASTTSGRTANAIVGTASCVDGTKDGGDALTTILQYSGECQNSFFKFDVSSITGLGYDVSSANIKYSNTEAGSGTAFNCVARQVSTQTPTSNDLTTYEQGFTGSTLTDSFTSCKNANTDTVEPFNSAGITVLTNSLDAANNWFTISMHHVNYGAGGDFDGVGDYVTGLTMSLQITYYYTPLTPSNLKTNTQSDSQINLSWDAPVHGYNNTNYKIFKSIDGGTYSLHTTLGNVTLANIIGLDSARSYAFKVSTNNTNAWSANATGTNSTLPEAPLLTSLIPVSKTKINVEFSDNSDGSDIDWKRSRYALFPSGTWINLNTNATINTPRFENFTGLSEMIKYSFQIAEGNNGGWGAWSSNGTATTITSTTGTLTFVYTNIGDVALFNGTLSSIIASPSPQTATTVKIIDDGVITETKSISNSLVSGSSAAITFIPKLFTDDDVHSIKLQITVTNGTGTISINSTAQNITREYDPDYFEAVDITQGFVNYTIARLDGEDQINLKVNREENLNVFNVECLYRSMTEAALGGDGTWHNYTSVYFMNDTLYNAQGTHYYIDCYNDGLLFSVVSYTNSSMLLAGIEVFDNTYGTFIGVPVGVFFVVLIAGMANQRTAPMWIVVILAVAGIMSALGFFVLEQGVWALALIAALLGIIVGRKLF